MREIAGVGKNPSSLLSLVIGGRFFSAGKKTCFVEKLFFCDL